MNETYEKEIDLKWLLYRVLRAWKAIVVWAVVIALLVGIGSALTKGLKLQDEDFLASAKLDFEREHAYWVATEETLLTQLKNLEKDKLRQQEYNEKSVLMQIDPLQKFVASFELYVDYDYQIMPEMTYQSVDLSDRILKSYATYMTGGEMYNYIMDNLDYELELHYLDEILTLSVDYQNNMISVGVVHSSAENCQEILKLAREGIYSRLNTVKSAIADHELTVNNQNAYETIDLALEKTQEENIKHLSDVDIEVQEVSEKLQEWALEPEPVFSYEIGKVIRGGIKAMIIGGVAGAVAVAAWVAVVAMLSDKLLNPEDLKNRFGLRIVGSLPRDRVKEPFAWVSRIIAAFGGITAKPEDYAPLAQVIGSSIRSDIAARKETDGWKRIVVTGTVSEEKLLRIAQSMALKEYTVACASNILVNAAAVDQVAEADCVLLVEEQEKTVMTDVEKELEALKAWHKPVLGAVVINADAVM